MPLLVFVYGTLRQGESNDIAQAAARHGLPAPVRVGLARAPGVLVDYGDWPGLLPDAGPPRVLGEVYRIDAALAPVLDAIEEIDDPATSPFVRDEADVRLEDGGATLRCLYYPIRPDGPGAPVATGADDWCAYRLARRKRP